MYQCNRFDCFNTHVSRKSHMMVNASIMWFSLTRMPAVSQVTAHYAMYQLSPFEREITRRFFN